MVKPFIKWAGGKTYLLNKLLPLINKCNIDNYCEVMVGGGVLFWNIHNKFKSIKINDINYDLINLYKVIRDYPHDLIAELQLPKYNYIHKSDPQSLMIYKSIRAESPNGSIQQAARIMFLLHTCFNGLMRTNKVGRFNVPPGSYKNPEICNKDLILADSVVLQGVNITQQDAITCINSLTNPTLLFIDPPYYGEGKFTSYSGKFDAEDQKKLILCMLASNHKFIYTNRADQFIINLFNNSGAQLEQIPLKHSIQPKYTTGVIEQELIAHRLN